MYSPERRAFLKTLMTGAAVAPIAMIPNMQASAQSSVTSDRVNVRDFGALGDGVTDDSVAIQSAINTVASGGGGAVYVPAGTYIVSTSIDMFSHCSLYGDGMGSSVLRVKDNVGTDIIGVIRTFLGRSDEPVVNVKLSDITLDGNRENQTIGLQFGFFCGVKADVRPPDEDIVCWRVETHSFRGYGFDPHELTNRLFLIECVSHDNVRDGFAVDGILNGVVRGCIAYGNLRHGFNVITSSRNVILEGNISYENQSNGITVQNGSHDIQITGNMAYNNVGDGIYCSGVNDNFISANQVMHNQENGIRLRGCARTTLMANRIYDNSQRENDNYSEIILDDDGAIPTVDCAVMSNHVSCSGTNRSRYGIRETPGNGAVVQANNSFVANRVSGAATSNYGMSGVYLIRALNA